MMPDKLESKIKESLRDTEIPFDPSGWERLERDLDARGSKTSFKLNMNWKYSLNTVLVVTAASALVWGIVALSNGIRSWTQESNTPAPVTSLPKNTIVEKTSVPSSPTTTDANSTGTTSDNKEVVVQQFFPTQVYNIQYPVYSNQYSNPAPQNDHVALENQELPDGEFSDLVKNRPIIINPMVRPFMLGESTTGNTNASSETGVKTGGAEMKLTPEEMRLFKEITLTRGRGELIFGDQIDPRKGIIGKSKEGDSVKTIFFSQDAPTIIQPEISPTDSSKTNAPK